MGINEYIKIGDRIKQIRKSNGITQKEMAKKLSIPYSTYSNYENNNREPGIELLNKIADSFDCSVADLLGMESKTDPYFSYYLEEYLKDTGYRIEYDEDNAAIFLVSDKECYEITENNIKDIKSSVKSFIQFKLSEIMKNSRKVK